MVANEPLWFVGDQEVEDLPQSLAANERYLLNT